ncbi:hypothetical protein Tco_0945852, partial [Tanacetum coccineum]
GSLVLGFPSISLVAVSGRSGTLVGQGSACNRDCGRRLPSANVLQERLICMRLKTSGPQPACLWPPGFLFLYITMSTIRDIKSKLSQKALDALCTKYHIPACVHPSLPGLDKNILQSPDGQIGPSVNCFRAFYTSSYTKGWMSFIKRSDAAPKSKILSKDPPPKLSQYDTEACDFLRTHTAPFRKFPEPFLCWVGISCNYTLDENCYPMFWDGEEEMDLFAFIRHSDPTKVQIGERNLAEREVKLLKMTAGRTVSLNPPTTAASGDNIDMLFDEGDDADKGHPVEQGDYVLEETIIRDVLNVVVEKAKKKRKRKVTGDASGSTHPPKKLRDDYQPPLVTAFVVPTSDVGLTDSMSELNLRTCPPHVRYVISSDDSHQSSSYSEGASFVRSPVVDAPVVTIAVTTTVVADVAAIQGSKARVESKNLGNAGDFASAKGQCRSGKHLKVCLGAEVRMRVEHILEKKSEFEDRCAEQTLLLSERDAEISRLKSLLSLKETEAAEAIRLRVQLTTAEATGAAKDNELRDLKERNSFLKGDRDVMLTSDLSDLQLSHDVLISQVASLESERDGLISQEMAAHLDEEFYPRFLTAISGRCWILTHGLKLVILKCLRSPEYCHALGTAIGCAINKGIHDGLRAGIDHGNPTCFEPPCFCTIFPSSFSMFNLVFILAILLTLC